MATGTPIKGDPNRPSDSCEALLDYPGKKNPADIMSTPAPEFLTVACKNGTPDSQNRLYFGENLSVLASLLADSSVVGRVKLVYIDPPFSTQTSFHSRKLAYAYDDNLSGTRYLEFLRERLILLKALMANDGSIYLHLDHKMIFHMKLIMDEVFGPANFRNCITRKKCNPKNYTRKQYGNVVDYILFYTKTEDYTWNRPLEPWTKERAKEYQYKDTETGKMYMKVPVHAPGVRNGDTGKPWRGVLPPPGKHWQFPPAVLDQMDARGEIWWSANGNPRRKVFLENNPGVGVQDIWLDFRDAHNQNVHITGYPTEKNPNLLARIIEASSNRGDLVIDCFCGSGTTLAAASSLQRNWIGVDNSEEALRTTLNRLENGLKPMGDFVATRIEKSGDHQHSMDPLWAPEACNARVDRRQHGHTPIRDFSLLAERCLTSRAQQIVRAVDPAHESNSQFESALNLEKSASA